MDFPIFHLDFFGNRMLIASIAIFHVVINHALAVGAIPLIVLLEWWGFKMGDADLDGLAHKILRLFFIITTSFGALSGVGIWFSTSLVNPYAIGSLIRVFFWAWFAEWIVFVSEVCLILAFYLLWKRWDGEKKVIHIRLGVVLSLASWLTMAVIVGILGFMMDPGAWSLQRGLPVGFFNPIYLPQLSFRTPMAMIMAGVCTLFAARFLSHRSSRLYATLQKSVSLWILAWLPPFAAGSLWYREVIPDLMAQNLPVALSTVKYQALYSSLLWFMGASLCALAFSSLWGAVWPGKAPAWIWALSFALVLVLTGQFERSREFIRKPYAIGGYMYANGIRVSDYPLLMKDGVLSHSAYATEVALSPENHLKAGKELFMITCSRCHTLNGVNSVVSKLHGLYGAGPWDPKTVDAYISGMHGARPFMPPFPGSAQERMALSEYLVWLQANRDSAEGAQAVGISPGGAER